MWRARRDARHILKAEANRLFCQRQAEQALELETGRAIDALNLAMAHLKRAYIAVEVAEYDPRPIDQAHRQLAEILTALELPAYTIDTRLEPTSTRRPEAWRPSEADFRDLDSYDTGIHCPF
jgi:hypothetical protein